MTGSVGILNVGAGDTKLSFDPNNPAERIRACRIVRDMLRRGYALLVEVTQPDGTKAYQRALDFREDTAEYIIADFDPGAAYPETFLKTADEHEETGEAATDRAAAASPKTKPPRGRPRKAIPAEGVRAVAVARTAGG
jgi:hypothetical protein